MELTKIDPVQFGLSEIQATEIANKFLPVLSAMQPLLDEYELIKDLDPSDPANTNIFGELRKKLVKVRTNCASIHKAEKAYFLNGGRYVDTYKNKQLEMSEKIEADLAEKEEFAEIQEQNRKKELQLQRVKLLAPFGMDGSYMALSDMSEETFSLILEGAKVKHEKSIADQKEADRLAKIKAEQDRLEAEERHRKSIAEAEERATKAALEKAEQDKIKAQLEASEKLRLAEEKAKAELEKAKRDAEKAIKDATDKAEAERKEAERLKELELEKQRQAEIEKERLASLAPDKEKAEKYIADIRSIKFPEFTTDDYAQRKLKFGNLMKMAIKELIGE